MYKRLHFFIFFDVLGFGVVVCVGCLITLYFPQHALSGNACIKPFDPRVTCKQECIITTFQDVYFISESFEEAKVKMRYSWLLLNFMHFSLFTLHEWSFMFVKCTIYFCREFAKTIKRPFSVRYNPYTQSIDMLKDTPSINSVVEELRHELDIVGDALNRLNKQSGVWKVLLHAMLCIYCKKKKNQQCL